MANASPQVFLVDGEWLWKWIGRARGQNKDEIFLPGRAGPAAAGRARGTSLEFKLLGQVEALEGGRSLPIGGPKPRALLAHLLLGAGRAIGREELVDELWGDDPPPTARDSLNVHAGVLRRALGARLRTVPAGYLLEASPSEIDAAQFETQVAEVLKSPPPPVEFASALAAALALWRGPVYGGIPVGPSATAARACAIPARKA